MDGFIVIDKPVDMTSHTVVSRLRRILGEKKAGHTGTLDPFATGVLPVALGEATKALQFLDESEKEYDAVMRLGSATDSYDLTGSVTKEGKWQDITFAMLQDVIKKFEGKQSQIPPMFSALKRHGVPLYKLARKGETVQREPREIFIGSISVYEFNPPYVRFSLNCSRGTYVRTIANDIGELLGSYAHLTELRRVRSGPFSILRSITLEKLEETCGSEEMNSYIIPVLEALAPLPKLNLLSSSVQNVKNGKFPVVKDMDETSEQMISGKNYCLTFDNRLIAVAKFVTTDTEGKGRSGEFRLLRVFN
ncbi:MAG: tRNA pseudouridine(55) synthase TruB [Desulfuromonadales bacterium]|nr:tRNA pseudouridine(55) synthase TruB [Desulfuromonadales bacterium]